MAGKEGDKAFFMKLLIIACIFMAILSFSIYSHMRGIDAKYKTEKAAFIKEKMDLKDELDSIKSDLKLKTDSIASLESEKKAAADELSQIKKSMVDLEARTSMEKDSLIKSANKKAEKEVPSLNGYTPVQAIKELASRETNESVRKFLDNVVEKLNMITEGKVVALEPIVVTNTETPQATVNDERQGSVISFDKGSGLVIVNIGRDHSIREGQKLTLYNEKDPIAKATVIKLRYKVSAAVIETYLGKNSAKDVKEGLRVTID